jgi:hypothetical protein
MEYNGPIYEKPGVKAVRLQITSTKILEGLIAILGVTNQKSLMLATCNIPEDLIGHFIRGYYDGDGTIRTTWKNGSIRILGTQAFLSWIADAITRHTGIEARYIRKREFENVYELSYHTSNMLKVLEWLYKDATIKLARKYQRYVNVLSERSRAKCHTSK